MTARLGYEVKRVERAWDTGEAVKQDFSALLVGGWGFPFQCDISWSCRLCSEPQWWTSWSCMGCQKNLFYTLVHCRRAVYIELGL